MGSAGAILEEEGRGDAAAVRADVYNSEAWGPARCASAAAGARWGHHGRPRYLRPAAQEEPGQYPAQPGVQPYLLSPVTVHVTISGCRIISPMADSHCPSLKSALADHGDLVYEVATIPDA